jgi:HK97 family phage major capsid protein
MSDKENMEAALKGISEIRDAAEASEKKHGIVDAETKAQIKLIGEEASKALAAHQDIDNRILESEKKHASEIKLVKDEYAEMYKAYSRGGTSEVNVDAFAEVYGKHKSALSLYLREGVAPGSDAVNEIANAFVEKSMGTAGAANELAAKNAVYEMVKEQGDITGKGFYYMSEAKTMVTGINPDGGYFTAPDSRTDLSVTQDFETSPMRAISNIITAGSGSVELPVDDNAGITGGWVGEITARPRTGTPQIGLKTILVHEQYANPAISQKMLDDAFFNVEAWLSDKTNAQLLRDENTAFVVGDGSAKPRGFLDYPNWTTPGTYQREALEQIASGVAGEVGANGLRKLQGALKEFYQAGASFLCKRDTFTDISLLKDGAGRYLLNERLLPDGVDVRLLGKPLRFADDMPAAATDSLSVAYGDFNKSYNIVDRMGIRVLRDPYSSKPLIEFYTTKRVGGDLTNYEGIKIQKLAVSL